MRSRLAICNYTHAPIRTHPYTHPHVQAQARAHTQYVVLIITFTLAVGSSLSRSWAACSDALVVKSGQIASSGGRCWVCRGSMRALTYR